jgi:hypothetical protein
MISLHYDQISYLKVMLFSVKEKTGQIFVALRLGQVLKRDGSFPLYLSCTSLHILYQVSFEYYMNSDHQEAALCNQSSIKAQTLSFTRSVEVIV